jgi:hypothetical protein
LAIAAKRYRVCRSGVRGLNLPGQNRVALLADHIDLGSSFAWQRLTLEGGLDGRYRAARKRLATMARAADQSTAA